MSSKNVLISASKSMYYSIIVQLIFRAVTFTMNVVIVRFLSRDILGVVNVRLMLLYNTVFILTSEPFTRACLKNIDSPTVNLNSYNSKSDSNENNNVTSYDKIEKIVNIKTHNNYNKTRKTCHNIKTEDLKQWSSVINLLWGCFPVGLLWAVCCSVIWLTCLEWPDNSITSSYSSAVILYALSAVIELLSEPIKIVTQILLLVKIKPFAEGLSLAVETSVLVISVLYWPQVGLFAFCLSKLSYSCSVTISYYTYILYKIYKNTRCRCITNNNLYAKNIENDHKLTNINNNVNNKKNSKISFINNNYDDNENLDSKSADEFPFTSIWNILPSFVSASSSSSISDSLETPNEINSVGVKSLDKNEAVKLKKSTTKLLWSFSRHVILKQVFTEGEKYIMTLFGVLSFADQGVYSVVNNLGSLVVRILFLPMEESFYLFMSQTVKRGHVSLSDINDSGVGVSRCKESELGIDEKEDIKQKTSINLVATTYENVLRVRTLLGLTIATFGFSCSYLALQIFFGEKLSAPPGLTLLRWNCMYMLLVSINGITEGFLNASMDHKQVDRYNHAMLMFSVAFLLTSWFFTSYLSLGAVGFCLSNCCNMIFRIIYSLQQANRYFARTGYNPTKGLLLTGPVIGSYLFSFIVCTMSEAFFCHRPSHQLLWQLVHVVNVAICLLWILFVVCLKEKSLVGFVKKNYLFFNKSKAL